MQPSVFSSHLDVVKGFSEAMKEFFCSFSGFLVHSFFFRMHQIVDLITPEGFIVCVLGLFIFLFFLPPSLASVSLWSSYSIKCNSWNQLQMFYLLCLSWNKKRTGRIWL